MRERFRSFDSKISFFAFADIITAVSGMLIFITLLLATDLGHPTDNRSDAANSELERQLQQTLRQQAQADAENRGLQKLLTIANTAPDPDKLESDIARLRVQLTDEKSKHAGMAEQLAASKSTLDERDKILGITAVRERIQEGAEQLNILAQEDAKVREGTAALDKKITRVQSKIIKLRKREGQMWLVPDRSTTSKDPILVIVSGHDLKIERFDLPNLTEQFDTAHAHAGFKSFLNRAQPGKQYIVFLVRPSGIELFRDIVEAARANTFEVGFDALEEDREVHFTSPPPIDDEATTQKRPDVGGDSGSLPRQPGSASGTPGSQRGNSGFPTGGSENYSGGSESAQGTSGAPSGSPESKSTNSIASGATNSSTIVSTNTETGAVTNSTSTLPNQPAPPPPKPKSWWQRLKEWLGIG